MYEIWLHKPTGESFENFRDNIIQQAKNQTMSEQEEKEAIEFAKNILSMPFKGGEN